MDQVEILRGENKMRKVSYILAIIGIAIIIFGLIQQIISNECKTIDKNTDFWVRNCDYK